MLISIGLCGFWWLLDFVAILAGEFYDDDGNVIKYQRTSGELKKEKSMTADIQSKNEHLNKIMIQKQEEESSARQTRCCPSSSKARACCGPCACWEEALQIGVPQGDTSYWWFFHIQILLWFHLDPGQAHPRNILIYHVPVPT